jgi:predicted nucleotidyltransferase component of viral defense system
MADLRDYQEQAGLLVRVLPFVAREKVFALKGGTAMNLFLRPMPRLSVDIDLTYLPIAGREESLTDCGEALARIGAALEATSPQIATVQQVGGEGGLRLLVSEGRTRIKVEVSPVIRGAIEPPKMRDIHPAVQEQFGFASMPVLGNPDLYGGKICAALDRQHPRDLFDVMLLLKEDGLTRAVFAGFLVYLISHNRSMADLLAPRMTDLGNVFASQFQGMTRQLIQLSDLEQARTELLKIIPQMMTADDKAFLLSIKKDEPDWSLLNVDGVENLPAVQWKLQNIRNMSAKKHQQAIARLESVLQRM